MQLPMGNKLLLPPLELSIVIVMRDERERKHIKVVSDLSVRDIFLNIRTLAALHNDCILSTLTCCSLLSSCIRHDCCCCCVELVEGLIVIYEVIWYL